MHGGEFDWFDNWVSQRLLLTLTFARDHSPLEMAVAFGCDGPLDTRLTFDEASAVERHRAPDERPRSPAVVELLLQQGADPGRVTVPAGRVEQDRHGRAQLRVGVSDRWVYGVESSTSQGATDNVLGSLSAHHSEAFSVFFTPTVSGFLYARDGALLSGFDLVARHIRYGADKHYFDTSIAELFDEGPTASAAARLVQRVSGITLTRDLLERPLDAASLPG